MFRGQLVHAVFVFGALALFANIHQLYLTEGVDYEQLGKTAFWFWVSIGVAILHQIYVWFIWRIQLHYKFITEHIGRYGFYAYLADFFTLFLARAGAVIYLAYLDRGSMEFHLIFQLVVSIPLVFLGGWTLYSVVRFFGLKRAAGADHFFPEVYRERPFEQRGIFKYSSNSMYSFAIQLIWLPGLWLGSKAALTAAAFTSIYIWIHYFCTERPDMEVIYQ